MQSETSQKRAEDKARKEKFLKFQAKFTYLTQNFGKYVLGYKMRKIYNSTILRNQRKQFNVLNGFQNFLIDQAANCTNSIINDIKMTQVQVEMALCKQKFLQEFNKQATGVEWARSRRPGHNSSQSTEQFASKVDEMIKKIEVEKLKIKKENEKTNQMKELERTVVNLFDRRCPNHQALSSCSSKKHITD